MSRPSVPLLSVEIITDASIRLLETTGTFTIPKLAKSLGVTPSSLYNHVSGREEIIELMRGKLLEQYPINYAELAAPLEPGDAGQRVGWEELVLSTVRAMRRTYSAVPALVPLLFGQTVTHPAVVASYDRMATTFSEAGFADDDLIPLISMLDSFAFGAALDTQAPNEVWRFPDGGASGTGVEGAARGAGAMAGATAGANDGAPEGANDGATAGARSPLQRAIAAHDAATRAERSFEYGCQLLIAGLRQRMPSLGE